MAKIKWENVPDMVIWNKIKSLRKARKLKQAQVAVGADISITTLWMIEQGYEKKTSDETKQKLAGFFECDVSDLFPCEMIGSEPREKFLEKTRKGNGQPILE